MVSHPAAERAEAISNMRAMVTQPRFSEYRLHSRKKTVYVVEPCAVNTPVIPAQAGGSGEVAGAEEVKDSLGIQEDTLSHPQKLIMYFPVHL